MIIPPQPKNSAAQKTARCPSEKEIKQANPQAGNTLQKNSKFRQKLLWSTVTNKLEAIQRAIPVDNECQEGPVFSIFREQGPQTARKVKKICQKSHSNRICAWLHRWTSCVLPPKCNGAGVTIYLLGNTGTICLAACVVFLSLAKAAGRDKLFR